MEQTGIEQMRGRRISALSKGYRQRVGIAQALLGNPQVIVLDEPTVGLDPLQIIEIRDLIRELGRTHTVIFSSHILSEVQTICDQIIMIAHGKLVAFDTPEHLERTLMTPNEITITAEAPRTRSRPPCLGFPELRTSTGERESRAWSQPASTPGWSASTRHLGLSFLPLPTGESPCWR